MRQQEGYKEGPQKGAEDGSGEGCLFVMASCVESESWRGKEGVIDAEASGLWASEGRSTSGDGRVIRSIDLRSKSLLCCVRQSGEESVILHVCEVEGVCGKGLKPRVKRGENDWAVLERTAKQAKRTRN